jgi:diguanylate cyclase (GGDEF)-like protein
MRRKMGSFGQTLVYLIPVGLLLIAAGALALVQRRRANLLTQLLAERDGALENANHRLSQIKSQLSQLTNKDPVTHLLARHVVVERFQLLRTQARRYGTKFGIVLISLTDFEPIAERVGTEATSRLLASLGGRLVATTRESDTVGFMRGRDFAVLMPHVDSATGLEAVVAKLRAALQVPFTVQGVAEPLLPDMHIGKALYPEDGDDWTSILRAADGDLLLRRSWAAERSGENTAQTSESSAVRHAGARLDSYEVPSQLWEPLATLGLGWPVTLEAARMRFKELAKRDHPDANGGSRDAEERQKTLNVAYAAIRTVLEPRALPR